MDVIGGTYLTEMTCYGFNQTAKAYGEWQNPVWVNRIATVLDFVNASSLVLIDINNTVIGINATTAQIAAMLANLSINISGSNITVNLSAVLDAIASLSLQIGQGFNDTQVLMIDGFENVSILISSSYNNISLQITNLSSQVSNVQQSINNLTNISTVQYNNVINNITFLQQNMTNNFNYTNSLIQQDILVSNGSVDRNNSLLAQLLYLLINGTGTPVTGNTTWTEYSIDNPVFYRTWNIKVKAYDEYGRIISDPYVACTIVTSQDPLQYMDVEGNHFSSSIFIYTHGEFTWTTNCFRT
jgi:hypothetical protein